MRPPRRERVPDLRRHRQQLHRREEERVAERVDVACRAACRSKMYIATVPTMSIDRRQRPARAASRATRRRWRSLQRRRAVVNSAPITDLIVARRGGSDGVRCGRCRRVRSGPGKPFPLGPEWDGDGTNFSLFSENAERVELCLFDEHGDEERIEVPRADRLQLALLPPGRRARPALRLPRARAVRPEQRASGSTRRSC